jgi:hypothetical protein
MKKYHFLFRKNIESFDFFQSSMVYHIKIVGVVVKDDTDVLAFQVFEVFLKLLVLVFARAVCLFTITSVAQKLIFLF